MDGSTGVSPRATTKWKERLGNLWVNASSGHIALRSYNRPSLQPLKRLVEMRPTSKRRCTWSCHTRFGNYVVVQRLSAPSRAPGWLGPLLHHPAAQHQPQAQLYGTRFSSVRCCYVFGLQYFYHESKYGAIDASIRWRIRLGSSIIGQTDSDLPCRVK